MGATVCAARGTGRQAQGNAQVGKPASPPFPAGWDSHDNLLRRWCCIATGAVLGTLCRLCKQVRN
eukprot:scaffold35989_cov19-Tisochrysis_lutea.AAC.1